MNERLLKLLQETEEETSRLSEEVHRLYRDMAQSDIIRRKNLSNDLSDVSNTKIIDGDLSHSLEVKANLIVNGDVLSGCSLRCASSLTVRGKILSSDITCNGNLNAIEGIDADKLNKINIKGSIKAKFIRNADITCMKSVAVSGNAENVDISSRDFISIGGTISGGNLSAVCGVKADSVQTADKSARIQVGIYFKLEQLFMEMSEEIDEVNNKCLAIRELIKTYETRENSSHNGLNFTEKKKLTLLRVSLRNLFYKQLSGLKTRHEKLKKRLDKNRRASIHINKEIPIGTTLSVKEKTITISSPLYKLTLV